MVCGFLLGAIQIIGPVLAIEAPWLPLLGLLATLILLALLYRLWATTAPLWQVLTGGLLAAVGYFGTALHWLGKSANPDPATFVVRELVTTAGAMWLFIPWWVLWFGLARVIAPAGSAAAASVCAFVGSFAFANLLLGDVVMGIPMAPLSLVALDTPLAALFSVIGQFGVDAVLVLLGGALGCLSSRSRAFLIGPALVILALDLATAVPLPAPGPAVQADDRPTVYVAQPALQHPSLLPPDEVSTIYKAEMIRQIRVGVASGAELLVLPEGAFFQDLTVDAALIGELRLLLSEGIYLVAGFPRIEVDPESFTVRPYNSVMMLDRDGPLFVYDKSHLVPFGETMPAIFFKLGFDVLAGPSGGYGRGSGLGTYQLGNRTAPFSLAICYEIMVSGAVSREIAGAEWLLNLSSEMLFRGTIGPEMIAAQVRIRALETGLPILRATAHAYAGVILPDGSATSLLPADHSGGMAIALPSAEPSLFLRMGSLAYAPLYAFTLFLIGIASASRQRPQKQQFVASSRFNP